MKHITQSDHDNARLARLHTHLHGGERHDEGAGAVRWGCLCFLGWLVVGIGFLLKGWMR